jgi:hypothetical protein
MPEPKTYTHVRLIEDAECIERFEIRVSTLSSTMRMPGEGRDRQAVEGTGAADCYADRAGQEDTKPRIGPVNASRRNRQAHPRKRFAALP